MKKSLVLLLALIVLISGTAYYAQNELLKEKDQVYFTEKVLYGDKSVVEGVTVETNISYAYQLFWKTIYEIGESPKEETEYTFYPWATYDTDHSYSGSISFPTAGTDVMVTSYEEEKDYYGLEIAMKKLYDDTPAGMESSTTVYLKDYMDYYTFMPELELPYIAGEESRSYGEYVHFYFSESELRADIADLEKTGRDKNELKKLKAYLADTEAFQDFFKIPVLDTEVYTLVISKDESGVVIGMGDSHMHGGSATGEIDIPDAPEVEGADSFSFSVYSAFDDGDCYFTFDPHTELGNLVDVSQIPGGYGVYHFTYDSQKGTIDLSDLKMVYPLGTETHITEIRVDGSGKNILLFTWDENGHYMSVIDRETLSLVDVFTIGNSESYLSVWTYEDYMVISTENLMVFEMGEDGSYTQAFSVDRQIMQDRISLSSEYFVEIPNWNTAFDWNGETLLMANRLMQYSDKDGFDEVDTCNFYVAAVSERGLLYYGEYESSLGNLDENYRDCRFNPDMEFPINIRWK